MNKVWLLIIILLLAACGGGGGSSNPQSGGGQPGGSGQGSLLLEFADKTPKTAAVTTPEPGWIRVVVSNPNLNGTLYKQVQDIAFGAAPVVVSLPVGTGYSVEAVFYAKSGGRNQMSRYGVFTGIDITEGNNTAALVETAPLTVSMTAVADSVDGLIYSTAPKNTYSVTATIGAGLQPGWSLAVSTSPFTGPVHLAHAPAAAYTAQAAPSSYVNSTLYFQGEFFVKSSLLTNNESATNWTFHFDAPTTKSVLVHAGTSSITPPADTVRPQVDSFAPPATVQATTTVAPFNIQASDNAVIVGYQITESDVAPALDSPNWSATVPASYTVSTTPIVDGLDSTVRLYAWVKDHVQVSLAVPGVTDKLVTINNSPQVTRFVIPALVPGTAVPVTTFTGKNNTGLDSDLRYLITQASVKPTPAHPGWSPAGAPPASYDVTGVTQTPGTRYPVQLFAWIMDQNGSVSRSLSNTLTISDAPQVTAFTAATTVAIGSTVPVSAFTAAAAPGHAIDGYLITTTKTVPAAAAFAATMPSSFDYPGLAAGVAVSRYVYAWVKDERGVVSPYGSALVRFAAP